MNKPEGSSAIKKVRIMVGRDGLAYYTAVYGNGEDGPRSEGYGTPTHEGSGVRANLVAARAAAKRDFPGIEIVVV